MNPGVEVDIGANASAEEAEEDLADDAVQINDVVYSFRLAPTEFDKKSYMTYIKGTSASTSNQRARPSRATIVSEADFNQLQISSNFILMQKTKSKTSDRGRDAQSASLTMHQLQISNNQTLFIRSTCIYL